MQHSAHSARVLARSVLITLSLLAAAGCNESSTASPSLELVDLVRDQYGVPHVFAKTDRGAYYGLGWAAAEDRFLEMTWTKLVVQGRVAEVLGRDAGDGSDAYVEHDLRMRLAGYARSAERQEANLDSETRNLLEAFADGVNDYVATSGNPLHQGFQTFGVPVETWRPADSIAIWMHFGISVSGDAAGEAAVQHMAEALQGQGLDEAAIVKALFGDQVIDEAAAAVQQADVPAATQAQMAAYAQGLGLSPASLQGPGAWSAKEPHFSQAWAVSGSATTTGETVVVADPRFPLFVPSVIWEAHVVGGTFEARGMAPPGSPNFLVGATRNVAWGGASLSMDQADLFEVETDPAGHPGQYRLDGVWRPFEVDESEQVLVAAGSPVALRYRETIWGPLATRFPGDDFWIADVRANEEFAYRWAPSTTPSVAPEETFVALYRADDATAFGAALSGWSQPSLHVVFGDRAGRVGYWSVGALPVREPSGLLAGLAAQDGTLSSSAWLDIVPHALMPHTLDPVRPFVATGNQIPVGGWYPIPFVSHGGHTPRSARLYERLADEFPLPGDPADPSQLMAIHDDAVWILGRDLTLVGVALRDGAVGVAGAPAVLSPESLGALAILDDWVDSAGDGALVLDPLHDGTLDDTSLAAAALAWHLGQAAFRSSDLGGDVDPAIIAQYGFGEAGLLYLMRDLRAQVASATDLEPAEAAWVEFALERALSDTAGDAGPQGNWAAWYQSSVLSKDLVRFGSLLGAPPLDPTTFPVGPVTDGTRETLAAQLDGSHTGFALLAPAQDPTISTLSPMGQSEHDASPHFADQIPLWQTLPQSYKPQPFDRAELEATAGPTTTTTLVVGSGLANP